MRRAQNNSWIGGILAASLIATPASLSSASEPLDCSIFRGDRPIEYQIAVVSGWKETVTRPPTTIWYDYSFLTQPEFPAYRNGVLTDAQLFEFDFVVEKDGTYRISTPVTSRETSVDIFIQGSDKKTWHTFSVNAGASGNGENPLSNAFRPAAHWFTGVQRYGLFEVKFADESVTNKNKYRYYIDSKTYSEMTLGLVCPEKEDWKKFLYCDAFFDEPPFKVQSRFLKKNTVFLPSIIEASRNFVRCLSERN